MFRLALLLILSVAVPAWAADKYSCMQQAEHRQFDFWAGSWQVSNQEGDKTYGNNTITIEEDGCLLTEQWQSASGGSGSSINYFNPGDGQWHQLWVDSGSSIIDIAGGLDDGSMVLTGTIYYLLEMRQANFRGSWTPLADGSVRQFFEEQGDQGAWKPWFDGYYRPLEATKLP
tara:strand:- start:27223 stop:27741 length:519 start_codon:yes stop_codon:yes gene_type:complete